MAIELMLNAVNLTFVTFARSLQATDGPRDRVLRDGGRGGGVPPSASRSCSSSPPAVDRQRRRGDVAPMVTAEPLLRWIVLLPALGFLWNATIGQRAPRTAAVVGPGAVGAAFVVAIVAVLRLHGLAAPRRHGAVAARRRLPLDRRRGLPADVAFRLDAISAVMILVVTGIGFLIHVYSLGYMHDGRGLRGASSRT
jgi:hypothetical protein